jgi:hypothetical protein
VEALTGLAFLAAPGATSALLFGAGPDGVAAMIGRLAGVALLAVATSCWGASGDRGGAARAGALAAITLYNAGAAGLLLLFAATGQAHGVVAWGAGIFHAAMTAAFAATLRGARGLEEG